MKPIHNPHNLQPGSLVTTTFARRCEGVVYRIRVITPARGGQSGALVLAHAETEDCDRRFATLRWLDLAWFKPAAQQALAPLVLPAIG